MVGMGDVDEMISTLAQILAEQEGDAVFRDDVMDVRSRGDDSGAGFQSGNDLALSFVSDGLDGDDGFAFTIRAQRGPTNKVDLTADA